MESKSTLSWMELEELEKKNIRIAQKKMKLYKNPCLPVLWSKTFALVF